MGFRFSLASVLRFRESVEKREEIALQRAHLEVAKVRHHIDSVTAEITKALDARERTLRNSTPANQLQNLQVEMDAAVEAKRALTETLQTLNMKRDQQMNLYRIARGNRQMLSNLLDQQLSSWEQEQLRTEQKQLDDIFAARSQRT